jgi:glycosyltransferase involved in cell wall biosynthesis
MRSAASNSENMNVQETPSVAVLVPCLNEGLTIGDVVRGFQAALPHAVVYVYDNNSTDDTAERAREAGAVVRRETLRGKGNVVRRMFADIEADAYVLVDGDGTYDATVAGQAVDMLFAEDADVVHGVRISDQQEAYRLGHRFGNALLTGLVRWLFASTFSDMLSGYRVFSRRFVKTFPAQSTGFETETELTIHALEMRSRVVELPTRYSARPEGSHSKLNTIRDGVRILRTIVHLVKEERPLLFFSTLFGILAIASLALAVPVVMEFMKTGLVPRFPTAILSSALMLLAFMMLTSGLVLDTVTLGRREMKRLWYLNTPNRATTPRSWPLKP